MKSRTKCTIVEATGVETIRYEDDDGQEREFDVDYKTYDRTVFTVYEDTSFYDYNGDLEFNEDAVMCGANRTQCSGVSYFRFSGEMKYFPLGYARERLARVHLSSREAVCMSKV